MMTDLEQQDEVRRDLGRAYRARLLGDSMLVLLGHSALIVLVVVLIWSGEHAERLAWWAAAVVLTTVARTAWLRIAARPEASDRTILTGARAAATAQGLAWGLGAALLMPAIPMTDALLVLVVLAGIGAGALATLAPDAPSFTCFLGALSVPLPFGILASAVDRTHLVASGVVVVFAVVLLALYYRAHAALAAQAALVIERRRAEEALRESEARLRALQNATTEAVALHEDGRIIEVNDAFVRLFGYDRREDVIGRSVLDFGTPESNSRVPAAISSGRETPYESAGALDQILLNCVTNARDAMPSGGRIVIEVGRDTFDAEHRRSHGWGRPGAYVTLALSDTGVGMDPETQRHIFEPFFTTKPVGQGTGLGMSMVYGLVKEHEGYVHVDSEPGQGTTVRLYFPAAGDERAEPVPAAALEIRGGTETVLLVEDDDAVRRAASRVLQRYGYRVHTAHDGRDALEVLQACERPPDLIVSDVVMPHLSGPQLLSKLREAGPVPRILFTSGYTGPEALENAELEPGVPLLPKPWTVHDLLRMVREALDARAPP